MDTSTLTRWPHVPLVVVERGGTIESVHAGSVAVVDADGRLVAGAGDPRTLAYTRSALKPLQALPLVLAGGVERYLLALHELAVICASHSGEAKHQAAVLAILGRAGLSPSDLQCGAHAPLVYDACRQIPPPPPYPVVANNCSGKHAGMLACCTLNGWPIPDYLDPDHPLQAAIRSAVARHTGTPEADLVRGIDGCSAPNYALPLAGLAQAYARLAAPGAGGSDGPALGAIAGAMSTHPDYVSGERRSDLALMRAGRGAWIAKVGAEGVQAIGLKRQRLGIAIKIADGATRAIAPAAIGVLEALGALDDDARADLSAWASPVLHNARRTAVGRVRSCVVLDNPAPGRAAR